MKRSLVLLSLSVAALAMGGSSARLADDPQPTDPISTIGHGAVFGPDGQEVKVTPSFVLSAQRFYLRALYDQAGARQRAEYNEKRGRLLAGADLTPEEQIVANAALIDWLIDGVKPTAAPWLASKNNTLRDRIVPDPKDPAVVSLDLQERLQAELGERSPAPSLTTGNSGAAYINECRAAGVPIPPDWGSPLWRSRGILQDEFISAEKEAEVFTFESTSPRGVCIALPRSTGNTIDLLGIICQGNDTSKTCFWDTARVPKGSSKPLTAFKGGAALAGGDVCTDCHAGNNAFVVHPGTPLDLGSRLVPNGWVTPLVPARWPINLGPSTQLENVPPGAGSCLTCHGAGSGRQLPFVSVGLPGYCSQVMENALRRTMPPGSPGNPAFAAHREAMRAACRPSSLGNNGSRYAAIFLDVERGPWAARHNMTGAAYQEEANRLIADGYRITYVDGFNVSGRDRYNAVFEKRSGPPWAARHGLTLSQYQQAVTDFRAQGFRLKVVNGYTVGGQDFYAAVWEQDGGPDWAARHGLNSAQYQQAVNDFAAAGFRLKVVSGYSVGGQDFYAAIWEQGSGPEIAASHGMTSAQYQEAVRARSAQGFTLNWVDGYRVGSATRFAAIWERTGGPLQNAVHNFTNAAYQDEVLRELTIGFRPAVVSGY